jgi:autotransporter-associated beta strand protein
MLQSFVELGTPELVGRGLPSHISGSASPILARQQAARPRADRDSMTRQLESAWPKPTVRQPISILGMHMNFPNRVNTLLNSLFAAAALLIGAQAAHAQQLKVDFRFDANGGANPTSFGSTTVNLTPGSAGQTYTIDIWATVVPASTTANTNLGLQSIALRGVDDGGIAFATGGGVGVVSGSFAELAPFNPAGFSQPAVTDLGKTTNNGTSATAGADGILDFGGTVTAQRLTIISNTGGPIFGGGATGSANTSTIPNGWQWEVGTFQFTIGAVSTAPGTTKFWPTLLASLQGPATAGAYSTNGSTSTSGPITLGSALTFIVGNKGSAAWNHNGNGNYGDLTNWDPIQIPDGAGLVATFGNGTTTPVNVPNVTVTVNAPFRAGTLNFSNTNGTSYILGNDGVAGDGLTLDNNAAGGAINSLNGNNSIFSNLILADNATFNVAGGSSVMISVGSLSESGASRNLTKTGAGTLTIDTPSSYTGTTLVSAGTLVTTPTGTISTAPLIVNSTGGVNSLASLNNNQSISSLSGTISGAGSAKVSVSAGNTLTVAQSANTTFAGSIALTGAGATLAKSSGGTLETDGAPALADSTSVSVSGGTLRFIVATGSATIGAGVSATVSANATLELAGAVSAMSSSDSPTHRVNISNTSTAAAGLLVTGQNQQVGGVNGSGTTGIAAGGSLTANHIIQTALVLGGTAGSHSLATVAASSASGGPLLGQSNASAMAGSLTPSDPFGSAGVGSTGLNGGGTEQAAFSGSNSPVSGGSTAVPEPSTCLLALLAVLSGISAVWLRSSSTD